MTYCRSAATVSSSGSRPGCNLTRAARLRRMAAGGRKMPAPWRTAPPLALAAIGALLLVLTAPLPAAAQYSAARFGAAPACPVGLVFCRSQNRSLLPLPWEPGGEVAVTEGRENFCDVDADCAARGDVMDAVACPRGYSFCHGKAAHWHCVNPELHGNPGFCDIDDDCYGDPSYCCPAGLECGRQSFSCTIAAYSGCGGVSSTSSSSCPTNFEGCNDGDCSCDDGDEGCDCDEHRGGGGNFGASIRFTVHVVYGGIFLVSLLTSLLGTLIAICHCGPKQRVQAPRRSPTCHAAAIFVSLCSILADSQGHRGTFSRFCVALFDSR